MDCTSTLLSGATPRTVVVLEEYGDGERADLVLGAGGEGSVHRAHDAQGLHDQREHLRAELGGQLHQPFQDAGQEGLQHVGALRQLQLVTVAEGGGGRRLAGGTIGPDTSNKRRYQGDKLFKCYYHHLFFYQYVFYCSYC